MQKIIEPLFTPEDYYDMLDAQLTDVLREADAVIGERAMDRLIEYNRLLRVALGLPVTLSS